MSKKMCKDDKHITPDYEVSEGYDGRCCCGQVRVIIYMPYTEAAQQSMHWTAGIVRRFKQFPAVKFILSLWHSLASRQ